MHFNVFILVSSLDSSGYICVELFKILGTSEVMFLLILLACAGLTLALEDEQLYCGPRYTHLCLGKGQHVACQFPVDGSGPNCQNYSKIRFTSELRNYITNFINKRRQRIAAGHERVRGGKYIPAPQIMMYVEWDFELARLAQRLADQCYFVHDECRATVKYPYAGQAVGEVRWRHLSNSYELSAQRGIRRVFDAWWGERRRVEPQQLVQPFRISDKGLVWGHFSQIAVWTLRAVGCGAVRHGEEYPRLLLVCDFSHTNMLGERTLNPGTPQPCPERTRRKVRSNFPLLCASIIEQIKQSRKVEDDVLDDSDYDDPDQDNHEMKAIREELKKLGAITSKPKQKEEDWPNNRLKSSEEVIDESTRMRWTTTTYIDEFRDEEDFVVSTQTVTKASNEKKKIKIKHNNYKLSSPEPTERRILVEEDDKNLPGKRIIVEAKTSCYDHREKLQVDMRGDNSFSEADSDDQETLILSGTSTPFVLPTNARPHKQDRLKIKLTTSTVATNVIQNAHMQYSPRQRWKPIRDRPERPGAAALLRPSHQSPTAERLEPAIPPRISFKMDDDDAEQLREDTGFQPLWKENETLKGTL